MLQRIGVAVAFFFSAPWMAAAQGRPIPERDIERVRVELDSTLDRISGQWSIATKTYHRRGLSDLDDDLAGNAGMMSLAPSSSTPLSFVIHGTGPGQRFTAAHFNYEGVGWVFLTGRMLLLVDDSLRLELAGEGDPVRSEVGGCAGGSCRVREVAVYIVPDSVLGVLASAHSVEVRILGQRQNLDRRFKKQHLALARALWARLSPQAP